MARIAIGDTVTACARVTVLAVKRPNLYVTHVTSAALPPAQAGQGSGEPIEPESFEAPDPIGLKGLPGNGLGCPVCQDPEGDGFLGGAQ